MKNNRSSNHNQQRYGKHYSQSRQAQSQERCTYPICFGIYYLGKSTTRSSKIYVNEKQWDDKKKVIKANHSNSATLNRLLTKKLADLQSGLLLANDEKVTEYSAPKIVVAEIITPKQTVFDFTNNLISELRLDGKIGNAWVYESALHALHKYYGGSDLYFENIDYQFLDKYNKYLLKR